ncbi:bifunctional hydroxymethylpyrimidine kinase/phosphomethylpyrimidine kinase [Aquisalimonas lutea]|uniref:bifunctional hydroxymethylpyrimidine kinase/phosphomethylpyrimidine kinase n=1 Tax=Aquisalimonas lutea TaxID=1327750 RepID=UPI0025B513BE|nr:bifunctional hydroxymethylpyrimidine kinase/phosphomethylpyrimidine kinase [Aquisalimonas lutea]MDN3518443.1 bifunctional hydroxymethylpyrimidine kinase/phosphomethylpyrimidine kinase [Aquisalimonas lutea]
MTTRIHGRVLVVAGSDSGGGAGIQADIKAITALGGYAMTALTALTAQNTRGVHGVHPVPPAFLRQQIGVVMDDLGADALKTGMLHDAATIECVVELADGAGRGLPLVVDPVMVAQSGDRLLDESAVARMVDDLLPRAALITPNLPEAEVLLGRTIQDDGAMSEAAAALHAMTGSAVLLKGGHLDGGTIRDVLVDADGQLASFRHQRIATKHTHGTGCTLASAIAAGLARGLAMHAAVEVARRYLLEAIRTAPGFGHGGGPVNHCHTVQEPAQG